MRAEDRLTDAVLLDCPKCGLPAEVTDRFILGGAPDPVEHVKLVCVAGHWFTPPVDFLPLAEQERLASTADAREIDARTIGASRVHRLTARLKAVWDELDYAQRRMLEIQTGVRLTGER